MIFKDPKIFIFLVPFVAMATLIANLEDQSESEFYANGKVEVIKPKANHGKPIVGIRFKTPPYVRSFSPSHEFLESSNLKIGDIVIKEANSEICTVNNKEFKCL